MSTKKIVSYGIRSLVIIVVFVVVVISISGCGGFEVGGYVKGHTNAPTVMKKADGSAWLQDCDSDGRTAETNYWESKSSGFSVFNTAGVRKGVN